MSGEGEDGFTLAELLVALALLALMAAYGLGALGYARHFGRAGDDMMEQAAVDAAAAHLRAAMSGARIVIEQTGAGNASIVFEGKPHALKLVAAANDELEAGGLFEAVYAVIDGGRLTVSRKARGSRQARETLLLDRAEAVEFRYYGAPEPGGEEAWQPEWSRIDALPSLIEANVRFSGGDRRVWPRIIAFVHASR